MIQRTIIAVIAIQRLARPGLEFPARDTAIGTGSGVDAHATSLCPVTHPPALSRLFPARTMPEFRHRRSVCNAFDAWSVASCGEFPHGARGSFVPADPAPGMFPAAFGWPGERGQRTVAGEVPRPAENARCRQDQAQILFLKISLAFTGSRAHIGSIEFQTTNWFSPFPASTDDLIPENSI